MLIRDAMEWHNKAAALSPFSESAAYVSARGLRKEVRFDPATVVKSRAEIAIAHGANENIPTVCSLMWCTSIFVATSLHLCQAAGSNGREADERFFIEE
jgi:hypothetical protein